LLNILAQSFFTIWRLIIANTSFTIQPLIAGNSLFNNQFPKARWADAEVAAPAHLSVPYISAWSQRVVPSGRARMANVPLLLPPRPASRRPRGRIQTTSQRARIALCGAGRKQLVKRNVRNRGEQGRRSEWHATRSFNGRNDDLGMNNRWRRLIKELSISFWKSVRF
jgi:hypothetical protein